MAEQSKITSKEVEDGQDTGSPLLDLPAELRNNIYRYSLSVRPFIRKQPADIRVPPLLQVCGQIRKEASPIYYYEQIFGLDCTSFDCTLLSRWFKIWRASSVFPNWQSQDPTVKLHLSFRSTSQLKWDNLLVWARSLHNDFDFPSSVLTVEQDDVRDFVDRVFDIVERLRGSPWAEVAAILHHVKQTAKSSKVKFH